MQNIVVHDSRGELVSHGLTRVTGPFATPEDAWQCAGGFIGAVDAIDAPIEVIGNFVIPPLDSAPSRNFQTLHFDSVCRSFLSRRQMLRASLPSTSQPRRRRHRRSRGSCRCAHCWAVTHGLTTTSWCAGSPPMATAMAPGSPGICQGLPRADH
ncbi:MAG: hypothetical protein H0V13_06015 [Nocardioidaceae bacterium]|nr:hypothetical protein [Nocardioidaceae bacterium]